MPRRALACCRHSLRQLIGSPRIWALLILAILCFDRYLSPIKALMIDEGTSIGLAGLVVFLLNDSWVSVMAALGLLLLLFDMPKRDESQKYLLLRAGRKAWAMGQLLYVLIVTALYIFALIVITGIWVSPWLEWGTGWSETIELFVDGAYETYDSMLNYDPWILRAYTALQAAGLELALHYICFVMLGFVMCLVNTALDNRAGFLVAAAPAMLDTVIMEYFSVSAYYYSPLTLTRLSCLYYGDGRATPTVGYALIVLSALAVLFGLLFVLTCSRKEIHQ